MGPKGILHSQLSQVLCAKRLRAPRKTTSNFSFLRSKFKFSPQRKIFFVRHGYEKRNFSLWTRHNLAGKEWKPCLEFSNELRKSNSAVAQLYYDQTEKVKSIMLQKRNLFATYFAPASWSRGNTFVFGAGGLTFKSRSGQIGHSVANSSPPLRHFFKRSWVARARWRGDRVVNGPTSSGPNPKTNLKPKSCPKKPESLKNFSVISCTPKKNFCTPKTKSTCQARIKPEFW